MNKCVSLCNNLNEESYVGNKYLKDKVIDGELSSKELVDLDPTQIYPDNWKYLIEKEITQQNQVWKLQATTDQFKCPRCKARECTYYQLQIRSSDEPMTTFLSCVKCKKNGNWWLNYFNNYSMLRHG